MRRVTYAIVGASPAPLPLLRTWNGVFAVANLPARLVAWEIDRTELPAVFDAVNRRQLAGVFVAMPFEPDAAAVADASEQTARRAGAATLLLPRNGHLFAANTHVGAIDRLLGSRTFEHVLILGSGPTACAAGAAVSDRCRALTIASVEAGRARRLARGLGEICGRVSTVAWSKRTDAACDADLIFNTEPLSAGPDDRASSLPLGVMSQGTSLYDFEYRADGTLTPLQTMGVLAHAEIVDGLTHVIAQAQCALPHLGLNSSYEPLISGEMTRAAGRPPLRGGRSNIVPEPVIRDTAGSRGAPSARTP